MINRVGSGDLPPPTQPPPTRFILILSPTLESCILRKIKILFLDVTIYGLNEED